MDDVFLSFDRSNSCDSLFNILKDCAHHKSSESLEDNLSESVDQDNILCDYFKMIAITDETMTISSNGSQDDNILEFGGRISLAYENLRSIPKSIAEKFSTEAKFLDLSYNNFRSLSFLTYFKGLHTLILDRNVDLDESSLPYLPNLKILWINNCNITNIPKWTYRIQTQCPNLEHLSMMGNPGAKTLLNGGTTNENNDYRMFVLRHLPNVLYLDGVPWDYSPTETEDTIKSKNDNSGIDENAGGVNIAERHFFASNNFKDLFRFRKRQPSYPSSSTS